MTPRSRHPGALVALAFLLAAIMLPSAAGAYSYAAAGKEPLIVNREPLLTGIGDGDWQAADAAYAKMKADIAYLDENEDAGIGKAFADAMKAKDGDAVRRVLLRAYADEIERRLMGAHDQIGDYQTAKVLVVKAQKFYEAMAGDLDPDARKTVKQALQKALDAIGNPGLFGVGAKDPDADALTAARETVEDALAPLHPDAG